MNKPLVFAEEDEKEEAEEKASAAKKRHDSWHIPEFLFFEPLSAEEEKRITFAIYDLKKRIKALKRKIRKESNQEDASAAKMKDDLVSLKKEHHDLREEMIIANTRLVKYLAMSFWSRLGWGSGGRIDANDLFSEGIIGLRRAIDRFDPRRGFKFSTYAMPWIRQHIQRHIQSNLSILYVPVHIHDKAIKLSRIKNKAAQSSESPDSESADILDMNIAALANVHSLIFPKRVPLDHQVSEENELLGAEIIADSRLTPEDIAEGKDLIEKMIRTMEMFFEALVPRYREIIEKRVGAGKNAATLREIGGQMGLSHERIRQIEEIAWNKIKARASRLAMEGQKVPCPDLLEIIPKQKIENLIGFCRNLYALRKEQAMV